MALTNKMLQAMDIPAEKIEQIMEGHKESINALREERDRVQEELNTLKEQTKNVDSIKSELESAKAELEKSKSEDWKKKYEDIKSEYANFKNDTEAKAVKAKKESVYKKLLEEAGISSKRVDSIVKVSASAINDIKFDKDGNVEDAEKIVESVKTEWADFISVKQERGADVAKPPANNGGTDIKKPSRASELVAQYRNEHYGNPLKED